MKGKWTIILIGLLVGCIKPKSRTDFTDKINLVKLLDSSFNNKRDFNNSKLINLTKGLPENFEKDFKSNCVFFLVTPYCVEKLFFKPSIQKEDLFVFKFEHNGFLVFNRQTKKSLFFSFSIKQHKQQVFGMENLMACHFLEENLHMKFSILKHSHSIVFQKYSCDSKNLIVDQEWMIYDKFRTLFNNYKTLNEKRKVLETQKGIKPFRKDRINILYCDGPIFFLPTFEVPYEPPFDEPSSEDVKKE